jgi:hypothetical protein
MSLFLYTGLWCFLTVHCQLINLVFQILSFFNPKMSAGCFPSAINIHLIIQILEISKLICDLNTLLLFTFYLILLLEFEPLHIKPVQSFFIHFYSLPKFRITGYGQHHSLLPWMTGHQAYLNALAYQSEYGWSECGFSHLETSMNGIFVNISHVRWFLCHHSMARPQVADAGNCLQLWKIAVNTMNK